MNSRLFWVEAGASIAAALAFMLVVRTLAPADARKLYTVQLTALAGNLLAAAGVGLVLKAK